MKRHLAALILATVLTGCAGFDPFDSASDIEKTWTRGQAVLPAAGSPVLTSPESGAVSRWAEGLTPGRRVPVVVYLHGCTGIGNTPFLRRLAERGYAVVAPNSMARRYRPLQCDPARRQGGYNLFVYDFRQAELTYALQRLARLPWVDRDNLFLVGNSEGGVVAALYRGDEFNARVVTQWTCEGAPLVRGIGAPADTPVLSVVRRGDPWYGGKKSLGQRSDCGRYMQGRPGSRSIVLEEGDSHVVYSDPGAVQAILSFLEDNRQ